jgi:putative membrane protein insertion efficiency factor
MPFWNKAARIPNYLAQGLIFLYRNLISPFYTRQHCIYYPTCSQYAMEAFKKYPFWTALKKTTNRISRCHPGNEPGVDLP